MPRLDFYVNYIHQATIRLEDSEVLIGRDSQCAVEIPDDRVSRVHAVIRASGDGHEIENRGTNGTKINGRRINEPLTLQPGDAIFIGRYVMVYQPDDAPVAEHVSTVLE